MNTNQTFFDDWDLAIAMNDEFDEEADFQTYALLCEQGE